METDITADITAMSRELKSFTGDVKNTLQNIDHQGKETASRLLAVEQLVVKGNGGAPPDFGGDKSVGQTIVDSEGFAMLQKGRQRAEGFNSGRSRRPN